MSGGSFEAWKGILKGERLPAMVVDLDAFDRNVERIASILASPGSEHLLRVASKSVRVPALLKRVLSRGRPFQGLMCFAVEEARFLAQQGFDDFLIAYPTLQDSDLRLLKELHQEGKSVSLVVDSLSQIERLQSAMSGIDRPLSVILEVDMALRFFGGRVHLGVRRSPVRSVQDVLAFFEAAARFSSVKVTGLMGYEAQVAGLGDRNPVNRFLNPIIRLIRSLSVKRVARLRREISEALAARGIRLPIFNGGGTGSLSYAIHEPWLTELTAGSGFFDPHLFDHYSNLRLEPSCYFVLQAVRIPDPGWVTCQGGGYIASGSPGWDKVPVVAWPEGSTLSKDEGSGEVQTPVRLAAGASLQLGDPVFFRHAKAGELAERFSEAILIQNGKIVDRVKTYRGHGQCYF